MHYKSRNEAYMGLAQYCKEKHDRFLELYRETLDTSYLGISHKWAYRYKQYSSRVSV